MSPSGGQSGLRSERSVLPAVFFQHVREFDDELALLILLREFESVLVLPAQSRFAALAENVSDGVQSGEQDALLRRAAGHIDDGVEEVRTALTALKGLTDELVVGGQMSSAVDAAVSAVTVEKVCLKGLSHRSLWTSWTRSGSRVRCSLSLTHTKDCWCILVM